MSTRKSLIPKGAQIPVALILGALLVLLFILRINALRSDSPAENPDLATPVPSTDADPSHQAALEHLRDSLASARQLPPSVPPKTKTPPVPGRNPFLIPEAALAEMSEGNLARLTRSLFHIPERIPESIEQKPPEPPDGPTRETRLNQIILTGTFVTDRVRLARINGVLCQCGDEVQGFLLQEIGERRITLVDHLGTQTIEMRNEALR